jgi:hypothetical protein
MRAFILSCQQDFLTFASACFELLTGKPLPRLFYLEAIAFELNQIWRGKNRRQIFNLPPGFFKSFLASICWPAYLLGLNPRIRVMVASSNLDLAAELSNAFRRILSSDFYKRVFPGTRISRTKNTELEVVTTMGGYRLATSMEGAVGRRTDILICDDPLKPADAQSQRMRDRCHELFCSALVPRLDDQANDAIIVPMQRLHDDDLAAGS